MTTKKVAFYILNDDASPKRRTLYTCSIIEKAYKNNRRVYVHTTTPEESANFDTGLWTFSDISFVPHEIYDPNTNQNTPILIGHSHPPLAINDILVNTTSSVLPFYPQFNHIIEVISNDEDLKALARKRFKSYQNDGYNVEVFNIMR